ncbi:hypothetical protein Kisp01_14690 [Kineosporia sp. NBRC 101677]|uniref:hypothetical protein n=1 Tax=Kineosporia sp. NBRC 101677 TaxID=3032197 RepID=UPI0024A21BEF|nr:hypothetical protein [Kineosporia sp. NBRC 101677]GLY14454.1 hypothetical protein Kisp01_14690 [Kineosporia sp. NBRC 101677]
MRLRDQVESLVRSWGAYEEARGGRQVIDYDCAPTNAPITPATSRIDVYDQLTKLNQQAKADGETKVEQTTRAHLAYLSCVLGERPELDAYMRATQGCGTAGWSEEYVTELGDRARKAYADLGITWDANLADEVTQLETPMTIERAATQVQVLADEAEPVVRELTGTTATYTVDVQVVDIDDYWSFWVDGAGHHSRLRFNQRTAVFTEDGLRFFAQHELLGHALQLSSFAQTAENEDVDWVRTMTVHLPYQPLLEGLATAWPIYTEPHNAPLMAKARLNHYLHIVRGEVHRAINAGFPLRDVAEHVRARAPWLSLDQIGNLLSDRGTDPLLRSYLWSYTAGTDWFMNLGDQADEATIKKVLTAVYHHPHNPTELAKLWPAGPTFGGDGAPIVLRRPAAA